MNNLSIEQQLKLKIFSDNLKRLSEEEVKNLLIKMFKESMIQQNEYENIIQKWRIK